MLHKKVIVGLYFFSCVVLREVELTPIVTLPPENIPTTTTTAAATEYIASTTSSESPITGSTITTSTSVIDNHDKLESLANSTESGERETSSTLLPLLKEENSGNKNATTTTVQSVTRADDFENNHSEKQEEATTPELLKKTEASTAPSTTTNDDEVTQLSVTSQALVLKTVAETASPQTSVDSSQNATVAVKVAVNDNDAGSKETEGNYKDKAPLEFHPYIEGILGIDETDENDTLTQSAPIRVKSEGYQSPQNTLMGQNHPYGPLPKFAEKEMNKLRLNHWRVRQILKGDAHHNDPKVGHSGTTDKLQGKNTAAPLSPYLGQKRASLSAITAPVLLQSSAIDQDEFHTSVLASDADAALEKQHESSSPSKLRTFFNWISNPLKRKPSKEDERLKQARAQQPILPFALGYRGDFLFW